MLGYGVAVWQSHYWLSKYTIQASRYVDFSSCIPLHGSQCSNSSRFKVPMGFSFSSHGEEVGNQVSWPAFGGFIYYVTVKVKHYHTLRKWNLWWTRFYGLNENQFLHRIRSHVADWTGFPNERPAGLIFSYLIQLFELKMMYWCRWPILLITGLFISVDVHTGLLLMNATLLLMTHFNFMVAMDTWKIMRFVSSNLFQAHSLWSGLFCSILIWTKALQMFQFYWSLFRLLVSKFDTMALGSWFVVVQFSDYTVYKI